MFERTNNLQLSVIKQMELLASSYLDVVSLAQGIPSFDTPGAIKRRAERAMADGLVAKYSLAPGLPELREQIEISSARESIYYDWERETIVTAGSIEGITASLLALTVPGDEVLICDPTYTSYREAVRLCGCEPVFVPLNEDKGWALDIEAFRKAITPKTKVIFYCNPNNPTGTIFKKEELMGLAELAQEHDLYIISDEAYKDFLYDGHEYISLAQFPQYRQRLVRLFSFSKSYAMTGWRVAYIQSDERLSREILKVHDSLVTCAPVISQYAALGALEAGEEYLGMYREEYQRRRDLMCSHLDTLSAYLEYVKPSSAYFALPKIKNCSDSLALAKDVLEKVHLATVPGVAFGPSGEGHLRLSFGRTPEHIEEGCRRLADYFRKYASNISTLSGTPKESKTDSV